MRATLPLALLCSLLLPPLLDTVKAESVPLPESSFFFNKERTDEDFEFGDDELDFEGYVVDWQEYYLESQDEAADIATEDGLDNGLAPDDWSLLPDDDSVGYGDETSSELVEQSILLSVDSYSDAVASADTRTGESDITGNTAGGGSVDSSTAEAVTTRSASSSTTTASTIGGTVAGSETAQLARLKKQLSLLNTSVSTLSTTFEKQVTDNATQAATMRKTVEQLLRMLDTNGWTRRWENNAWVNEYGALLIAGMSASATPHLIRDSLDLARRRLNSARRHYNEAYKALARSDMPAFNFNKDRANYFVGLMRKSVADAIDDLMKLGQYVSRLQSLIKQYSKAPYTRPRVTPPTPIPQPSTYSSYYPAPGTVIIAPAQSVYQSGGVYYSTR